MCVMFFEVFMNDMPLQKRKTAKIQGKIGKYHPPKEYQFKPGQSGNPLGRPKGRKNFETYFMEAWKEVAEALRMDKDPDRGKVEILKIGFKQMFKGNYQFWKDFMERLFGKPKTEINISSKGKPIPLLDNLRKKKKKKKSLLDKEI